MSQPVKTSAELLEIIGRHLPGDKVALKVDHSERGVNAITTAYPAYFKNPVRPTPASRTRRKTHESRYL